jgi:hypothetical protein
MRINRNWFIWAGAAVVTAGAAAFTVIAAGPGPDVLTQAQATAQLAQARSSALPVGFGRQLAADEWYATLPSAAIIARCDGDVVEIPRWDGPEQVRDLVAGPGATVSGGVHIDDDRVEFTARCDDGIPSGSYRWLPVGEHRDTREAPQKMQFGKWVESGLKACVFDPARLPADPETCERMPTVVLSGPPGTEPWSPDQSEAAREPTRQAPAR